jgi:hypothetical protein
MTIYFTRFNFLFNCFKNKNCAYLLVSEEEVGGDGGVDAEMRLAGGQGHQVQPLLPTVPPAPEQLIRLLLPPVNRSSIKE